MPNKQKAFWKNKNLHEFSSTEWESLCDGCGRCCLHKLLNLELNKTFYTSVACRYLDTELCRCTQYSKRQELVPDCIKVTPQMLEQDASWLPKTCAYRRLAEGRDIPRWHPLRTGRKESVHEAGISVRGRCISEAGIADEDLDDYVIDWIRP
ncbi:MAG: YcgN family cysteine cluster protein [Gammaproteobacteria bacterium]|nr:YcgN family cysteine cluster protein [Gammaproteobacteria bacterium]NNC97922.1 YcgN family cysteine cluster protein [Gammaproteobacteria bacterium]NNM14280.1 YcgN family cysteine cluster protein [Gammaproteobacteria bacterium]